jgi:hypothetical protein
MKIIIALLLTFTTLVSTPSFADVELKQVLKEIDLKEIMKDISSQKIHIVYKCIAESCYVRNGGYNDNTFEIIYAKSDTTRFYIYITHKGELKTIHTTDNITLTNFVPFKS